MCSIIVERCKNARHCAWAKQGTCLNVRQVEGRRSLLPKCTPGPDWCEPIILKGGEGWNCDYSRLTQRGIRLGQIWPLRGRARAESLERRQGRERAKSN